MAPYRLAPQTKIFCRKWRDKAPEPGQPIVQSREVSHKTWVLTIQHASHCQGRSPFHLRFNMFHGSLQGIWAASDWNLIAFGLGFYPSFLWLCSVQTPLPSRNIDHHPQGAGHIWLHLKSGEVTIRRPESVCSSNKICEIQTVYKIQNPNGCGWACHKKKRIVQQSRIQNPRSRNPKCQIQNPNSKTPKSKQPVWILDLGWRGRGSCSKRWCMAIPATRIWPRRWAPKSLQPKALNVGAARMSSRAAGFCYIFLPFASERDLSCRCFWPCRFPSWGSWSLYVMLRNKTACKIPHV